jgi:hypothetical protein
MADFWSDLDPRKRQRMITQELERLATARAQRADFLRLHANGVDPGPWRWRAVTTGQVRDSMRRLGRLGVARDDPRILRTSPSHAVARFQRVSRASLNAIIQGMEEAGEAAEQLGARFGAAAEAVRAWNDVQE